MARILAGKRDADFGGFVWIPAGFALGWRLCAGAVRLFGFLGSLGGGFLIYRLAVLGLEV